MKSTHAWMAALTVCVLLPHPAASADDTLEEIVVTAGLRSPNVAALPPSVTGPVPATMRDAGAHLRTGT